MNLIEHDEPDEPCEKITIPVWYFQALINTLRDLVEENKKLNQHLNPPYEE